MANNPGRFITFEGGEGGGKTTQITLLKGWLISKGITTVSTREPGGTEGGQEIRKLVVEGSADRWSAKTETLLYMADRCDHIEKIIKPNLEQGIWVLSDRFVDSTYAYQSYARGLPLEDIKSVYNFFAEGFEPDFTLLLDIDPKIGLERAAKGRGRNLDEMRFESIGLEFHQKIREGYLDMAKQQPERYAIISIDDKSPDQVHETIRPIIQERFKL